MKDMVYIHPEAKIATGVTIDCFSYIHKNVEIGSNTWIGSNVTIFPGTKIGPNCKIFPGAVIGAIPQDMKFDGEHSVVEIGENTTIRECVTINRATKDKKITKIGTNCLLMAYTHIAHDTCIGDHCILANQVSIAGHVKIDDWVTLGGLVAVQQFVHIGTYAFVAGASLVRKNVPPYVKAAREPISYMGVNTVKLKRNGFLEQDIKNIEDTYHLIFIQNQNVTKGIEQAKKQLKDIKVMDEITYFIRESPNGVIKGNYRSLNMSPDIY